VNDRLTVLEERDRFLVAHEDDLADWVCAFAKDGDFPARQWAENMARTYNARAAISRTSSPRPPAASGR
jgi:hypothetical protein